jgi:hypothetical protein
MPHRQSSRQIATIRGTCYCCVFLADHPFSIMHTPSSPPAARARRGGSSLPPGGNSFAHSRRLRPGAERRPERLRQSPDPLRPCPLCPLQQQRDQHDHLNHKDQHAAITAFDGGEKWVASGKGTYSRVPGKGPVRPPDNLTARPNCSPVPIQRGPRGSCWCIWIVSATRDIPQTVGVTVAHAAPPSAVACRLIAILRPWETGRVNRGACLLCRSLPAPSASTALQSLWRSMRPAALGAGEW